MEETSLSDHTLSFSPGRVVSHGGTAALHCRTDLRWNDETEALYMEQVRGRARQKAREILEQALAEAESIREQARDEGFSAGQAEATALGQAEAQRAAEFLASLRQALMDEKERVFHAHKDTLFQIMRAGLEKTLGVMLEERREEILKTLLEEAVDNLQARTTVTLHVCPDDLPLARELAGHAREIAPELPELTIRSAPDLGPGGLRLESGDGLVDNSVTSRFEQVRHILDEYRESGPSTPETGMDMP